MKKIAIIGASDFQNPLILKAKELGFETHVFAWKDDSIGEKTADYFYPISIVEKEAILEKCKELKIDAITTIATDLGTIVANYVGNKMHLNNNSMECTKKATNKYEMRKAFKENNIPIPNFEEFSIGDSLNKLDYMNYPLIVKPTDRSGSRAITKVLKKEELNLAINVAIENSFEKKCIIEEYIEGEEFSLEGITYKGKHKFLTITRKSTTNAPNFIETGHIEPARIKHRIGK